MGDPLEHAKSSAKKFGGVPSDYLEIHTILDSSKRYLADWRHRALLHNTFGIELMENHIIGPVLERKSDGESVCTRTIVSEHIKEDLNGIIPTPGEFLREMPISMWMSGVKSRHRKRMQQLSVDGSEEPSVIYEKITWHPYPEIEPELEKHYWVKLKTRSEVMKGFYAKSRSWVILNGSPPPTAKEEVIYWSYGLIGP